MAIAEPTATSILESVLSRAHGEIRPKGGAFDELSVTGAAWPAGADGKAFPKEFADAAHS